MKILVALLLSILVSFAAIAGEITDAELLAIDASWNDLRLEPDVAGVDSMTGMTEPEYRDMILKGGRPIEGNRYVGERK